MIVEFRDAGDAFDTDGRGAETTGFLMRTFEMEAMRSFESSVEKNRFLEFAILISGFLTKSTAPAESASNTLRLREETRMTGSGFDGRSCFKNSIPFIPGISTSKVTTSGCSFGIFCLASYALIAYPTTSMSDCEERNCIIICRKREESSTINTFIFFVNMISTLSFHKNIDL